MEQLISFDQGSDGGTRSIKFRDQKEPASGAYLLLEGIFYHAARIPGSLFARIQSLEDSTKFHDVSFARAATILEYLIDTIPSVLEAKGVKLKKGSVISLLTLPYAHSFFYSLALVRLGCQVQFFNHELGRDAMDILLGQGKGGCQSEALLYCGLDDFEVESLGIDNLQSRIGVKPIEFERMYFAAELLQSVPHRKPRDPMSEEGLKAEIQVQDPAIIVHTSGSTSVPKLVRLSIWGMSRNIIPLPHIHPATPGSATSPILNVSRAYWGTSLMISLTAIACGTPVAFCYPENRLYPSTKQALEAIEASKSTSILFYPGQMSEVGHLIAKEKKFHDIVSSIKVLYLCGAGVDEQTSNLIVSLQLPTIFINLHGWSEVGGPSGLVTASAPYDGLQVTGEYSLFEPMGEENNQSDNAGSESHSSLVKLWIGLDKHPCAWHMFARGYSPLRVESFPGPGPMRDRPAVDTGDLFEARKMEDGSTRYFYFSRDDDLVRLANLYRPNVYTLESALLSYLTAPGRLHQDTVNAVQLFGNMKPKLSLIVQLTCNKEDLDVAQAFVHAAVKELDKALPEYTRFLTLQRVKIIRLDPKGPPVAMRLLKTHKGTLRRGINLRAFTSWIDSLDYS